MSCVDFAFIFGWLIPSEMMTGPTCNYPLSNFQTNLVPPWHLEDPFKGNMMTMFIYDSLILSKVHMNLHMQHIHNVGAVVLAIEALGIAGVKYQVPLDSLLSPVQTK
jgi:hypothetical protein